MLNDICLKFYMLFMQSILKKVDEVNLLLQKNKVEPLHLNAAIRQLKKYLQDLIYSPVSRCLLARPKFPLAADKLFDKLTNEKKEEVTQTFTNFVVKFINELNKRTPKNLEFMASFKFVNQALKTRQPDIKEFLQCQYVKNLFKTNDKEKIVQQYNNLPVAYRQKLGQPTDDKFWIKASNINKELSSLMLKMCTIPFSNAQIERDFSMMNLSKTKLQCSMSPKLLNAKMIIRSTCNLTNRCCSDFPLPNSLLNEVGRSSLYNDRGYDVDQMTDAEYNEIQCILKKTPFCATQPI